MIGLLVAAIGAACAGEAPRGDSAGNASSPDSARAADSGSGSDPDSARAPASARAPDAVRAAEPDAASAPVSASGGDRSLEPPDSTGHQAVRPAAGDSITGLVQVTGSAPITHVVLQLEEGASRRLVGALEEELRQLAGAVVAVWGERTDDFPGNALRVDGYRVVSVDGRSVHVGVLVETDEGIALESDGALHPISVPGALGRRVGAKVWIAAEERDGVLRVQSYGIIRPG